MGWGNGPPTWAEMERVLSGRPDPARKRIDGDGGDSPAWSRKREKYEAGELERAARSTVPYARKHTPPPDTLLARAPTPQPLGGVAGGRAERAHAR
ncbi:hypothetical protein ACFXO7_18955, partial [Nocardia tengchongensis]|uniref:hypothetical protein n=1 Tax=Nocardia tengchongensis TaxID=2055889 RepID=UPI0036A07BA5